jgi:hypothetical protein
MAEHSNQHEGRVDVMARYGLKKLAYIAKKGPRGKPPTPAEIETASVSLRYLMNSLLNQMSS